MAGIATIGGVMRGMDERRAREAEFSAREEDRAFLKQQRELEGIARAEDRTYQIESRERERARRPIEEEIESGKVEDYRRGRKTAEKVRGIAATYAGRAKADKAALAGDGGIMPAEPSGEFQKFLDVAAAYEEEGNIAEAHRMRQAAKSLRDEGMIDVLKAATRGASGEEIRDIFNAAGTERVSKVVRREEDGKIILEGHRPDGSVVTVDVQDWMGKLGMLPKKEFDIKEGHVIEKGTGTTRELPERGGKFALGTNFEKLKFKNPDGSEIERLVDLRNGQFVTPGGQPEAGAKSPFNLADKEVADRMLKYLTAAKGQMEGWDPKREEQVQQAYQFAEDLIRKQAMDGGAYITPERAAHLGKSVVAGVLKPEDLTKLLQIPRAGAPAGAGARAPGAAGQGDGRVAPANLRVPVPTGAPNGSLWITTPTGPRLGMPEPGGGYRLVLDKTGQPVKPESQTRTAAAPAAPNVAAAPAAPAPSRASLIAAAPATVPGGIDVGAPPATGGPATIGPPMTARAFEQMPEEEGIAPARPTSRGIQRPRFGPGRPQALRDEHEKVSRQLFAIQDRIAAARKSRDATRIKALKAEQGRLERRFDEISDAIEESKK